MCLKQQKHEILEYLVKGRALRLVGALSMLVKSIEGLMLNLLCLTQLEDLFSPPPYHPERLLGSQKSLLRWHVITATSIVLLSI